jgi:uncharacterized protein
MIRFEGTRSFAQPPADVAAKLSDAGFLAGCVPDAEITDATPDRAVGKVRPKLSFLTGALSLEATVTAREPGQSVSFQLVSKVIGGSSTVTTALAFRESATGGTDVVWVGELIAVTGLLKVVPKGLLEGAAKKVIEDIWAGVAAKLA